EWECCLKDAATGAREGAEFIRQHIIPVADRAFDDFAAQQSDDALVRAQLGLAQGGER
ncbi:MAG TPA: AP endonuclease, partial [Franconibacter pulveris]|nr:AP endonuclease [Franconibacter pulveris]